MHEVCSSDMLDPFVSLDEPDSLTVFFLENRIPKIVSMSPTITIKGFNFDRFLVEKGGAKGPDCR